MCTSRDQNKKVGCAAIGVIQNRTEVYPDPRAIAEHLSANALGVLIATSSSQEVASVFINELTRRESAADAVRVYNSPLVISHGVVVRLPP